MRLQLTKISSVKTEVLKTHLVDDFVTTYGKEPEVKYHVMIKITSDEEVSGIGEASPLPDLTGETHPVITDAIERLFCPVLIGSDPFDLEMIHHKMDCIHKENNASKAAIDMALYDLIGKTLNVPVYKLLGGLCREQVEVGAALGLGKPSEIAGKAKNYADKGAKAIKLKVGVNASRDIETVRTVRELLGGDIGIRVDANTGYSLKTANHVLNKIEKWDIEYAEQPLAANDLQGLRSLRESTTIPIMVDESLNTIEDAVAIIRNDAADLFGLKLIKHGGIHKAKKIVVLAETNGIDCVIISPWETQIGQAAGIHLALSSHNFNYPHDLGTEELVDDPTKGLHEERGIIFAPKESGLGVKYSFESE